jgi:hypothetical protein
MLLPRTALLALVTLTFIVGCDDKEDSLDDELVDEGDTEGDETEGDELANIPPDVFGESEFEPCDTIAEARPCDDGAGTQFCDTQWVDDGHELVWGECLPMPVCTPGELRDCDIGTTQTCELEEGVPYWGECPFTPLLLSFDGGPIELEASSATFDIASVGECLDSDWPVAANPWLVIDLDKNGFIDAGHELFGSGTRLPAGDRAQTGFAALAVLDGNGDGVIDQADARFDELLLWRDEDADKLSMGWELSSLGDEGIERIELDFAVHEQCDARGNCARERSRFEFVRAGQRRVGEVVDVYLACN